MTIEQKKLIYVRILNSFPLLSDKSIIADALIEVDAMSKEKQKEMVDILSGELQAKMEKQKAQAQAMLEEADAQLAILSIKSKVIN